MRSRYRIHEPAAAHFITSTIIEWLPVFTTAACCDVLIRSFEHCRQHKGLTPSSVAARRRESSPALQCRVLEQGSARRVATAASRQKGLQPSLTRRRSFSPSPGTEVPGYGHGVAMQRGQVQTDLPDRFQGEADSFPYSSGIQKTAPPRMRRDGAGIWALGASRSARLRLISWL